MGPQIRIDGRPEDTRLGIAVGYLSYAFVPVWLVGTDTVVRRLGLSNDHRPLALWLAMIALAFVPIAVVSYIARRPTIGRRLGWIKSLPAIALIDLDGLRLTLDGVETPRIPWDDVASLERTGPGWRLVGIYGSGLATIPASLMWPRPSWSDAPSFAELVVQLRPDRFAMRGDRFEPGMTEFSLRRPDDIVGRPRSGLQTRVLGAGILLFIVAFVLLIAITKSG